jgi:hypothetical protein
MTAQRIHNIQNRWPKPPEETTERVWIPGDSQNLSALVIYSRTADNSLLVGLTQEIYRDGEWQVRQQAGRIEGKHLQDVLRQLCLSFGDETVRNTLEAVLETQ